MFMGTSVAVYHSQMLEPFLVQRIQAPRAPVSMDSLNYCPLRCIGIGRIKQVQAFAPWQGS
jgi:hypothetical protein